MDMDLDDLRAVRATAVIAREDARDLMREMGRGVPVREGFADRIMQQVDAMLPVVSDAEALAALLADTLLAYLLRQRGWCDARVWRDGRFAVVIEPINKSDES